MPKSRVEFWENKFQKNDERDRMVREELEAKDIKILIVWECTVKRMERSGSTADEAMSLIEEFIRSDEKVMEI